MSKYAYTRGQLAKKAGCNLETIRYYEKETLLPPPYRMQNGYRLYREEDVRRVRFIRRCRELGFTIADIRSMLTLIDNHCYTCADIQEIATVQAKIIKDKLSDLQKILGTLEGMVAQCHAGSTPDCPILETLFT